MSNDLTKSQTTNPLALYREKYQLSYRQLGKLLGITNGQVYNYVKGINYPSEKVKEQIAILTNQEICVDA